MTDRQARMIAMAIASVAGALVSMKEQEAGGLIVIVALFLFACDWYNSVRDEWKGR